MQAYTIADLTGNYITEQMEIDDERREDARIPFAGGLPDEVMSEMDAAFGHRPPTDEQMEADYAARRCEEAYDAKAAGELVARYPGLQRMTDQQLIDLIGDERVGLMGDADEAVAAAAVILSGRLGIVA